MRSRLWTYAEALPDALGIYAAVRDDTGAVVDFRVDYVNEAACETSGVGRDEQVGRSVREVVAGLAETAVDRLRTVLETGVPHVVREADIAAALGRDTGHRWFDVVLVPLEEAVAVTWSDVTDRVEAAVALAASEERYRRQAEELEMLYRTAPIGLCVLDRDHRIQKTNDRLAEMNGVAVDDALGAFGPGVDRAMAEQLWTHVEGVFATGLPDTGAEVSGRVGQDRRSTRHWLCSFAPLTDEDGVVEAVSCAVQDVTEQKRTTTELARARASLEHEVVERTAALQQRAAQLRGLASQLADVEKRERRRLADLLHDDVQQALVAATMQLQSVRRRADGAGFGDVVTRVLDLVGRALTTSRALSAELCPPVLYEAGLGPALRWLAEQFDDRYDLDVRVEGDLDLRGGDDRVRALLFESVRELLLNVVKHADVRQATLTLVDEPDGGCSVRVADTGCGFAPADLEEQAAAGFGLFGLRERLAAIGGQLAVVAAPGQGVRVTIRAPDRARGGRDTNH